MIVKRLVLPLLLAGSVACSSSTITPPAHASAATAVIKTITPGSNSALTASSLIEAEVEYNITNFSEASEYYLAPLFDSTKGGGATFNEFARLTDGWRLRQPHGLVQIRYRMDREWRNPELAKPVRLTFFVMVRTGQYSTRVIGKTEKVGFAAPN
jgi:hypothetical protein